MADVFISLFVEEAEVGKQLKTYLIQSIGEMTGRPGPFGLGRNLGELASLPPPVDVFMSTDVPLGNDWLRDIRKALETAPVVLSLFSSRSLKRWWIHFEAGAAWLYPKKVMIPICIGSLTFKSLPRPYGDLQGLELRDDHNLGPRLEGLTERLVTALGLKRTLSSIGPPPSLEESTKEYELKRKKMEVATMMLRYELQQLKASRKSPF